MTLKNLSTQFLAMAMSLGLTSTAQAISINSTFQFADDKGSATYTIINTTDKRIFLNAVMYEFYLEDGELKKIPYTRGNIKDWKIEVHPARAVINPSFEKDFRVTMKCRDKCDNIKDQAFQIGFVPTPYFSENERPEQAMQIAVGFGANFVNPGKESKLDYEITRAKEGVKIQNNGQALFTAIVSSCGPNASKEDKKSCQKSVRVLADRHLKVALPKEMRDKPLDIRLESVEKNFKETLTLAP